MTSGAPANDIGALPSCGRAPHSTGGVPPSLVLTVHAPVSAAAGTTVRPRVQLRARTGTVAGIDVGLPANVYVVRHGMIVGRYLGAIGGVGFGTTVTRQPVGIKVEPLLLSGCPIGDIDYARPDANRRPLPAGKYRIVAALESEKRHQAWRLVSSGATIAIHS